VASWFIEGLGGLTVAGAIKTLSPRFLRTLGFSKFSGLSAVALHKLRLSPKPVKPFLTKQILIAILIRLSHRVLSLMGTACSRRNVRPATQDQATETEPVFVQNWHPWFLKDWQRISIKLKAIFRHKITAAFWARRGHWLQSAPRTAPGRQRVARRWAALGRRLQASKRAIQYQR
jgi:hypothetical protein